MVCECRNFNWRISIQKIFYTLQKHFYDNRTSSRVFSPRFIGHFYDKILKLIVQCIDSILLKQNWHNNYSNFFHPIIFLCNQFNKINESEYFHILPIVNNEMIVINLLLTTQIMLHLFNDKYKRAVLMKNTFTHPRENED